MRRILIFVSLLAFALTSCTDKKGSQSTDNQLSTEETRQTQVLETENKALDQIETDIEESAVELDAALKDLDN